MKLNDKLYNVLKWLALIVLPALATFIVTIGTIWDWADLAKNIGATITAIALLIGAIIGVSQISYNKEVKNNDNSN